MKTQVWGDPHPSTLSAAYQLVLVGCDGDEDGLREDEGLLVLFDVAYERGLAVTLEHQTHSRLILVHRVQDDLLTYTRQTHIQNLHSSTEPLR